MTHFVFRFVKPDANLFTIADRFVFPAQWFFAAFRVSSRRNETQSRKKIAFDSSINTFYTKVAKRKNLERIVIEKEEDELCFHLHCIVTVHPYLYYMLSNLQTNLVLTNLILKLFLHPAHSHLCTPVL